MIKMIILIYSIKILLFIALKHSIKFIINGIVLIKNR